MVLQLFPIILENTFIIHYESNANAPSHYVPSSGKEPEIGFLPNYDADQHPTKGMYLREHSSKGELLPSFVPTLVQLLCQRPPVEGVGDPVSRADRHDSEGGQRLLEDAARASRPATSEARRRRWMQVFRDVRNAGGRQVQAPSQLVASLFALRSSLLAHSHLRPCEGPFDFDIEDRRPFRHSCNMPSPLAEIITS